MAFELLPAELLIGIFAYLPASDLKAVRSVCKEFRNTASPELFRSIVACARYQALGAFQKIILHPIYPKYVKEIIFDASTYSESLAKNEQLYSQAVTTFGGTQMEQRSWHYHTRWKRYQDLFTDQQEMVASGVLIQTIVRALDWLPNVSSIVYSPHPHLIPIETKVVRDLVPRGISSIPVGSGAILSNCDRASSSHAFRQLIGAIYLSQYTGVCQFKVNPMRPGEPGTEFSLCIFDFQETNDEQAARYFFGRLQYLELNMAIRSPGGRLPSDSWTMVLERLAKLANLLLAAQDLRHLAFHFPNWKNTCSGMYGSIVDEQHIFAHLGLQTTWPKLQSLSLGGIYANECDFIKLLKRHSGTLKSLVLRKCSLLNGVWADIVDEIVYNSKIFPFVLDLVNETVVLGEHWTNLSNAEQESWRYQGRLMRAKDGERMFAEDTPCKKSVYDSRT